MRTPYAKHTFGDEVQLKLRSRRGWLTAGVASSISWPPKDVCVTYGGEDYFLRGTEQGERRTTPCITVPCAMGPQHIDEAIAKVYRFTSILSWFNGGYVDVTGYISGSHPTLYGDLQAHSSMGIHGEKQFNCNHMPIIESENVRKALAFWREGQRLDRIHDSYSFLSFFKVIESQYADGAKRKEWVAANIDKVTEERAVKRISELCAAGVEVGNHLYGSGRCAVAHASADGEIVDPDIPEDRIRLSKDLVVMKELARIYIRDELNVADSRTLYSTRDRLEPWASLLRADVWDAMKAGGFPSDTDLLALHGRKVAVGLWPDGPIPGLERMTMYVHEGGKGVVRIVLLNERETIQLVFVLDYTKGRVHPQLDDGGVLKNERHQPTEEDVRAYATFFYNVFGNGIAELICDGFEPVDCEVVIPVNMMLTKAPAKAVEDDVEQFRRQQAARPAGG